MAKSDFAKRWLCVLGESASGNPLGQQRTNRHKIAFPSVQSPHIAHSFSPPSPALFRQRFRRQRRLSTSALGLPIPINGDGTELNIANGA
ncbi:hypothetical protein niasHT_007072 [Heterodera trifolii]|uniref:Uncharacterized protein n=1 Tax=Heterodera trifolii TaxID=157864 RepID=A0ABD2LXM2_9BILA